MLSWLGYLLLLAVGLTIVGGVLLIIVLVLRAERT